MFSAMYNRKPAVSESTKLSPSTTTFPAAKKKKIKPPRGVVTFCPADFLQRWGCASAITVFGFEPTVGEVGRNANHGALNVRALLACDALLALKVTSPSWGRYLFDFRMLHFPTRP
jgi:hypothetical protein